MTNAVQGVIDAQLKDGRTIKLVFDFNTWADAEEATGLSMKELISQLKAKSISARNMRALFWCGMKEHQPDITEREAGKILHEAAEAMSKALGAAMPIEGEEEEAGPDGEADPTPPSGNGAGTNS